MKRIYRQMKYDERWLSNKNHPITFKATG